MSETSETSEAAESVAVPEGARPRRKWPRRVFAAAVVLIVLPVAASVLLVNTGRGQRLALDVFLDRARGSLAGVLSVDGVRSGSLLSGATLEGVELHAEDGRRFLSADSVELRFSPITLLDLKRPTVTSVIVWGLDVVVSRYSSEQPLNIQRLLRAQIAPAGAQGSEPDAPPDPLALGRLAVRDGTFQLLWPARAGTTAPTVPAPDGEGLLRRLAFEQLDLDLEDAVLDLSDDIRLFSARLASLSMDVTIVEDPLRLEEAYGELAYGAAGISVKGGRFRLPGSSLRGDVSVGPRQPGGPWTVESTLSTEGDGDLADLAWLDDRVPDGSFSGAAQISVAGSTEVVLDSVRIELEASTVSADGRVVFGERLSFDSLDVTASPLALERLEPWIHRDIALQGWLSGEARFSGTLADVRTSGRVTLVPTGHGGAPTTADFSGTLHSGSNPGAMGFEARLDPLNYELLSAVAPDVPLRGVGTLTLHVSGRADEGLRFVAEATHRADSVPRSHALARGEFRRTETGDWVADVEGDLAPLSLGILRSIRPEFELIGELTGPVRAVGRLRDLQVSGEFAAESGRVTLDGVTDMRRPGSFYRFDATAESVPLDRFTTRLPERSEWSGSLSLEGRGVRVDSMDATATLIAAESRVGGLSIDGVTAHLTAGGGILTVDSLDAVLGGVDVSGEGRLGMAAPLDGEVRVSFATESLGGLRPLLLGDTVIAKDTLSALESARLRFEGIDVDALPDTADVRMYGSVRGTIRLVGSVDALDIDLDMEVREAVYGHNRVDSATVHLTADEVPELEGHWDVLLDAYGVEYQGRSYERGHLDADMNAREGRAALEVERGAGERLVARGLFDLDSVGGTVRLEEATATLDSLVYFLARPSRLTWDDRSVAVESLDLRREGDDEMSINAAGRLSRTGVSDFDLVVKGLHLERVARIVELDHVSVGGHLDLELAVQGPADRPIISGFFEIEEPRLADFALTRAVGELGYRAREANVRLDAWEGEDHVFSAAGPVPIDLSLAEVESRRVPQPMDLHVVADSLDASVALAYFTTLEDVVGTVSGEVRVRGTSQTPEPDGVVTLSSGGWSIEALGVRHTGVGGTAILRPDRTADLDLSTDATGRSAVTGTVTLDPISDPGLDLRLAFAGFQVVQRRDIESRISGALTVTGRYGRPVVEGSLSVDEATLFVDEFARSANIIDLADPRLFGADTTVFLTQPLLRDIRNPFLENLRADVTLSVPRATWLRSPEMDVEIGGDLLVSYSRRRGDLVLVGELQALRGSYAVLGRRFEVSGGTVGFLGTPGINPTLDIQATSRIRRFEDEALVVNANVEGTLARPRVALSTDEAGLVQSDLVSYLIFGRSSAELATGQTAFLEGAAGSFAGAATGFVTTLVSGVVASQIGAALAQGIGIDYLSITQAGDFALSSGVTNSLASTQVEIGQYVGPNAFIVVVFRPLIGQTTGGSFLGGARLEWSLSDNYTVEGFFEDRFLRSGSIGFANLGIPPSKVVGVFIFRELGY